MKLRLFAAILLAALASGARAQRVVLEVPLSPIPSLAPGAAAASLAPGGGAPLALSLHSLDLPGAPSIPSGAVPVATPLPALGKGVVPLTAAPAAVKPRAATVIDSLREHGALSAAIPQLGAETGASALERNFMAAASLGDDGSPVNGAGNPESAKPADDDRPLLERMLERVTLDDRGREDEKKALLDAFKRLLGTPTGRKYAEQFLAEDMTAVVRFDDFPDSKIFLVDNRKKFYAAQAYTDYKDGRPVVRLNRHYIDADPDFMRESLPSILGHELLGHGVWYHRASKADLYLAFHYHELNETSARLLGWAIDHELDGKFEDPGAWNFAQDPAHYSQNLKMRLPYYAVTFNQAEMADPIAALRPRVEAAKREIERAKKNLAAQKTWNPVVQHFIDHHGIPAERFTLLRREMADLEARYAADQANAESIVAQVEALIGRLEAEPERGSIKYLQKAATNPFFTKLTEDAASLAHTVSRMAAGGFVPPRPPAPRPADQITWEQLSQMYRDDIAADAKRAAPHWGR